MFFFQDVSIIISIIGVAAYMLFHIFFKFMVSKEHKLNGHAQNGSTSFVSKAEDGEINEITTPSKIMHFLKKPLLYQASLL